VSGTHSKTCHWCTFKSTHAAEVNRQCWGEYRRFLPKPHDYRDASATFGPLEDRDPPPVRTHEQFVADAIANETHVGYKKDRPYKTTGVKEVSPLSRLPLFNIVWDVCPDMMHAVPRIWGGHVMPMLREARFPAPVKPRKKWSVAKNAKLMRDHEKAKEHLKTWTLSTVSLICQH